MHRLQELVRLHRKGFRTRQVARLLKMSPNTERKYRDILKKEKLLKGPETELPEMSVLREAVRKHDAQAAAYTVSSIEKWREQIKACVDDGATPTAIYDKLRQEEAKFEGSLSAVKRFCARLKKEAGIQENEVAIPVLTEPGDVAQVDFGSIGKRLDPQTQTMRKAYVFVMVLGHSRHQFARIVFDQKIETWIALHVEAFEHFGGVPKTLVPDNLKSAVISAAFGQREDAVLNKSYRELARHYGFIVDPTPPRSPEKKGKVESGVKYVKQNFLAPRQEVLCVDELNTQLDRWVQDIAGKRTHGTTGKKPLEVFEQIEGPVLSSLPKAPWKTIVWSRPKVQQDSHVLVNKARYSVPWRLIGKRLLVRQQGESIEIYWEDTRVATHTVVSPGKYATVDAHLPPTRHPYRKRTRAYWDERAAAMGEDVARYIDEVFGSDDVLSQLSKVQKIVLFLEGFPIERATAACQRASFYGSYSYQAIKRILTKALDQEPLPLVSPPSSQTQTQPQPPRFARGIQVLLDLPTEKQHEPH